MRALLIVLESLGIGRLQDNASPAPNTLGKLFRDVPDLELPTLFSLGLGEIMKGRVFDPPARKCTASYGRMIQRSAGPDLLSGLWELAGVVLPCPFNAAAQLSPEALASLARECRVEFLLQPPDSLDAASGKPEISGALLEEHLRTGNPILTLGADSTLHLTAHEKALNSARLAQLCRIARRHADGWRIARVEGHRITGNPVATPRTLSCPIVPPHTLLNAIADRGFPVEAVGLINDAFARSGVTRAHPTASQSESLNLIERLWRSPQSGMIFAHLGTLSASSPREQARALEEADTWLAAFLEEIDSDSLLLITGSNHGGAAAFSANATRQEIPVLLRYGGRTAPLGLRDTLADVAATLASFFGIDEKNAPWACGEPLITFHRPRGLNGPW